MSTGLSTAFITLFEAEVKQAYQGEAVLRNAVRMRTNVNGSTVKLYESFIATQKHPDHPDDYWYPIEKFNVLVENIKKYGYQNEICNNFKDRGVMNFGGELRDLDIKTEPRYTAIYEIRNPDVLKSNEWGDAVEFGRWADEVRPFTSNRQFALRKLIQ